MSSVLSIIIEAVLAFVVITAEFEVNKGCPNPMLTNVSQVWLGFLRIEWYSSNYWKVGVEHHHCCNCSFIWEAACHQISQLRRLKVFHLSFPVDPGSYWCSHPSLCFSAVMASPRTEVTHCHNYCLLSTSTYQMCCSLSAEKDPRLMGS